MTAGIIEAWVLRRKDTRNETGEMRIFAAADISEPVRRELARLLQGFRKIDPGIKWVDPQNMHVTLYFFGETDGETEKKVKESVREAAAGVGAFTVRLEGLGGFPSLFSPRVLWAGVSDEDGGLKRIFEGIRDRVKESGLRVNSDDREYSPHLTLGRVKNRPRQRTIDSFRERGGERFGGFEVTHVTLYSSTLTRQGAFYTVVGEFPLRGV
ncbi:MAG: RNA 2',3'-cyclic phosphodiesterase [Spirochaetes bacterium]|nr:RNA 2',3'-cyclic phosphodiesterase [Spirochaetota bacterium]